MPSCFNVFVGIDISKDSFFACALLSPENIIFEAQFPMSNPGFKDFSKRLSRFPKNSILIAKESSGCYYINLFAFLSQRHFQCIVLNPLLVNKFWTTTLRKTKTDRVDAKAIATMLYHIHKQLPDNSILPEDFRDIARERERITQKIATVKNDIEKHLVVLFPELERIVNIYNTSILRLLSEFPSAYAIKNASIEKINKALCIDKAGRPVNVSAQKIKSLAKDSIAHCWPVREMILVQKIKELFFLEEQIEFFTNMLRKFCQEACLCQDIEILKSIKGIGDITAMHFLAEVGDIERFNSPKKLIAYCGIDPTVYESGRFKGKSKISKRGNRHLRRIVWLMTTGVVMHNEYFKEYFKKRRTEGLAFKKAILTTAHKLLRTIWAMLTKKQPFSVNHSLSPCF
uniref:IS110 family transposase n=1 Tax=Thermodesulfovibrio aggregans TaxID=86166 RepID=A0A7C4AJQ2_9BACT